MHASLLATALLIWGYPPARGPSPAQRQAAMERCKQALWRADPSERSFTTDLAVACAHLYRERACAASTRNPPADPDAFAARIARACATAYCPRLPAPRPKLCGGDSPERFERMVNWIELQTRIMALELDVDEATASSLFKPMRIASLNAAPQAPATRRPGDIAVYADRDTADRARIWIDGGKSVLVRPDQPDEAVIAALARDARAVAVSDARVIIVVDRELPRKLAETLVDVFKRQDFRRVSSSFTPGDEDLLTR